MKTFFAAVCAVMLCAVSVDAGGFSQRDLLLLQLQQQSRINQLNNCNRGFNQFNRGFNRNSNFNLQLQLNDRNRGFNRFRGRNNDNLQLRLNF